MFVSAVIPHPMERDLAMTRKDQNRCHPASATVHNSVGTTAHIVVMLELVK